MSTTAAARESREQTSISRDEAGPVPCFAGSASPTPVCRSFPPACAADARVLVLGSMPGEASLAAAQYYAHPRNAFWPIMGALFGAGPELPYRERLQRLESAGVALWDVIAACERAGSLDSAIAAASIEANDFARLFRDCRHIRHVFFNGAAAETAFRRHVRGRIVLPALSFTRLPSTSPAHAARNFEAKLAAWQAVRAATRIDDGNDDRMRRSTLGAPGAIAPAADRKPSVRPTPATRAA